MAAYTGAGKRIGFELDNTLMTQGATRRFQKLLRFQVAKLASAAALMIQLAKPAKAELNELHLPPYAERPMTLKRGTLRIDAAPSDFALMDDASVYTVTGRRRGLSIFHTRFEYEGGGYHSTGALFDVGLSYGIRDDVEIGALVFPLLLGTVGAYSDIETYTRWRFYAGERLELGLHATLQLPVYLGFAMSAGVPIKYRLSPKWLVDTGAEFELLWSTFGYYFSAGLLDLERTSHLITNLQLPFSIVYQMTPEVFLAARSGLDILDISDLAVPLGFNVGYSFKTQSEVAIDVIGGLMMPLLFNSLAGHDTLELRSLQVSVGANFTLRP